MKFTKDLENFLKLLKGSFLRFVHRFSATLDSFMQNFLNPFKVWEGFGKISQIIKNLNYNAKVTKC